jgi:hypothetical protein
MIKRLTQLCSYSVLVNGDPLEIISTHLQSNHASLAKLVKVCPFSYAAAIKILWHSAETTHLLSCVASADRQHYFASLIGSVHFFNHEII